MVEFGYENRRLAHIPNFIDAEALAPQFGGEPYFVWAGYMVAQKGPQVVLGAMREIEDGHLYLAGEGPYLPELRAQVEKYGLGDRVTFSGFLAGPDLWSLMGGATALVFPSMWYEVFGMVALEAYALGKPVIASRIGGIEDVVLDGETGFLVPAGDAHGFARAMQTLLSDPQKGAHMGKRARQLVVDEFGPEQHFDRLIALYEDVQRTRQIRTGRSRT